MATPAQMHLRRSSKRHFRRRGNDDVVPTLRPPWPWVVVVIAGAVLVACNTEVAPKTRGRTPLAIVNGEAIYEDSFRARLRRLTVDNPDGLPTGSGERAQTEALLDNLVNERLLLQAARKAGVGLGVDELELYWQRFASGWNEGELQADMESREISAVDIKSDLREMLLAQRYLNEHVFSRIAVTGGDVDIFLADNPGFLRTPERVRAKQIMVNSREEADKIARELRRGKRFADAAMEYSTSPEGKKGGELGVFSRDEMPDTVGEICFGLPEGVVSQVVESSFGFHLFKVIERLPAKERPIEQARAQAEKLLKRQKHRAAQLQTIEALRRDASLDLPTPAQLAELHGAH